MENLIYWIVVGGGFGFWRAWTKTSASAARARDTIGSVPDADLKMRAEAVGYVRGLRLVALLISTVVGAVLGAAIWGAATLLLRLIG